MATENHASAFVEWTLLRQDLAATVKPDLKNLWSGSGLPTCEKGEQDPASDHDQPQLSFLLVVSASGVSAAVTTTVASAMASAMPTAVSTGAPAKTTRVTGGGVPDGSAMMRRPTAVETGARGNAMHPAWVHRLMDGAAVTVEVVTTEVVAADEVVVVIEEEVAREDSKPIVRVVAAGVVAGVVVGRIDRIPVDRRHVVSH